MNERLQLMKPAAFMIALNRTAGLAGPGNSVTKDVTVPADAKPHEVTGANLSGNTALPPFLLTDTASSYSFLLFRHIVSRICRFFFCFEGFRTVCRMLRNGKQNTCKAGESLLQCNRYRKYNEMFNSAT